MFKVYKVQRDLGSTLDWVIIKGLIKDEIFKLRPRCQGRLSLRKNWGLLLEAKRAASKTLGGAGGISFMSFRKNS